MIAENLQTARPSMALVAEFAPGVALSALVAAIGGLVIGFLALTALHLQIPRYPTDLRLGKLCETNHKRALQVEED